MGNSLSFKPIATSISLITLMLLTGCASTKVSDRETLYSGKLPRPGQIIIYDFVATPDGILPDSALANQNVIPTVPPSPEQAALDRQLGMQIAKELAQQIQAMGLPGVRATPSITAQINDIMLHGYLLTIDKGSAVERVAIGFGAGASDLKTFIEGYQMTAKGPRILGQGDVTSGGSKTPGASMGLATLLITHNPVGLVVSTGVKAYGEASGSATIEGRAKATAKEIADQLKIRFEQQGWIMSGSAASSSAAPAVSPPPIGGNFAMGAVYATLPAGCITPNVQGGKTYYLCGNTWFEPQSGANGMLYKVVPTP